VTNFQPEGGCDKLTTIPETGGGFNGQQIDDGSNYKDSPSDNRVVKLECSHQHYFNRSLCAKTDAENFRIF
jgi:hypothetical protein